MVTFSALLAICAGNSLVTGEFPALSQWRGALMFSYVCAWMNGWVNNREAGDLRRHRAHYDVTVMSHQSFVMLPGLLSRCEGGPQSEFSSQRVSNSKLYLFVSQKKLLNKQSSCRWVRMPAHSYDVTAIFIMNKVRVLVHQAHCLRTWNNLNPSMDNESHAQYSVGWNYLPTPKLQRLYRWSLRMDK